MQNLTQHVIFFRALTLYVESRILLYIVSVS